MRIIPGVPLLLYYAPKLWRNHNRTVTTFAEMVHEKEKELHQTLVGGSGFSGLLDRWDRIQPATVSGQRRNLPGAEAVFGSHRAGSEKLRRRSRFPGTH